MQLAAILIFIWEELMMKNNIICRSFTFFTNRIPLGSEGLPDRCQYTSIGFFDGLQTEAVEVDYEKHALKAMWKYILELTRDDTGEFSHQNVFGIGDDGWNNISDTKFWDSGNNEEYPLTFVVFLQALEYHNEDMEEQCKRFGAKVMETLGNEGIVYVYVTVDKNDFIVCIKCKKYKCAMKSIKQLHKAGTSIVYSYSVFAIHSGIIKKIGRNDNYRKRFSEIIDSISLKGVTNSSSIFDGDNLGKKPDLDEKYFRFCHTFKEQIYENADADNEKDCKIYDILGDDDFRFIARKVKLGDLLFTFSERGCLHEKNLKEQGFLYSSNLTLNIENLLDPGNDFLVQKSSPLEILNSSAMSFVEEKYTEALEDEDMELISKKEITLYQSIKQTMESMKSLKEADTKKYEFYSLYKPFSVLLKIMSGTNLENVGKKKDVYEFLRAVGSTMHGTLRTDIRFFQIRDFNTIVHYAPSKLRAFYVAWLDNLSKFCGNNSDINPSFIISSGIYSEVSVRRLFDIHVEERGKETEGEPKNLERVDKDKEHLILVTVSEGDLYSPSRLMRILAHENSHFVNGFRKREEREKHWENIIQRIFELEFNHYLYKIAKNQEYILNAIQDVNTQGSNGYKYLECSFGEYWKTNGETYGKACSHYSKEAMSRIVNHYSQLAEGENLGVFIKTYIQKIFIEVYRQIDNNFKIQKKKEEEKCGYANQFEKVCQQMKGFYQMFLAEILNDCCECLGRLTSEMFSDFFAVLILNIEPEEYFKSCIYETKKKDWINEQGGAFFFVRMAIVIESIQRLCEEKTSLIVSVDNGFYENWNRKAISEEKEKQRRNGEDEMEIQEIQYFNTLEFAEQSQDMLKKTDDYIPVFGYGEEGKTGDLEHIDFFYDEFILNEFCRYLVACGTDFWNSIKEDAERYKKLQELRKSYNIMSRGTLMEVAIEIEKCLKNFEHCSNEIYGNDSESNIIEDGKA